METSQRPESILPVPPATPPHIALTAARRFARLIYTHNPLYLLSVCFVLHGTSLLLPKSFDVMKPYNPWPLVGLSSGYLVMMVATAIAIVRWGKVWDDARSILLIVVGMFAALSLSLDTPLAQDVQSGRWWLALGYGFVAATTEVLLRGLGLRLPVRFRLPLHGMLALIFLYPLWLVPAPNEQSTLNISWRVYLFSPAAALAILSLLPAVRRGAEYVRDNGSPWAWPSFPWAIFGLLVAGLGLRGYVLSLSFDPVVSLGLAEAMQLKTAFGAYFLVPILMAVAVVLLELGIVARSERAQRIALGIPFGCVLLSFPLGESSVPYTEFLENYMRVFASPVLMSAIAAAAFFAVAFVRRVRCAEAALVASGLVAAVVGPGTVGIGTLTPPHGVVPWLVAGFLFVRGIRERCSVRSFFGVAWAIVAFRAEVLPDWPPLPRELVCFHVALVAILALGTCFRDRFARAMRRFGAALLLVATLAGSFAPIELTTAFSGWAVPAYIATIIAATLVFGRIWRDAFCLASAGLSFIASNAYLAWRGYELLSTLANWRGIRSFVLGFVVLALAATISLAKAGGMRRLAGAIRFLATQAARRQDAG